MAEIAALKKIASLTAGPSEKVKQLWKPLRRFLFFSLADDVIAPKRALSVSMEKGHLSVAFGTRFLSRIALKWVKDFEFDTEKFPQPDEVVSSLALGINELGAPRNTSVVLGLPKAWTLIRTAEFPSTIKENMTDVVSFEMDRLTPFSPDEAFYDFGVLKETGDRVTLLIMAARADLIRPYIKALGENGFAVSGITVNLAGSGALSSHLEKNADAIYMELSEKRYEGGLFVDGMPVQTVSADFSDASEKARVDTIFGEVAALQETSKQYGGRPLRTVLLLADKSHSLKELLKLRASVPVTLLGETDPGLGIKIPHKGITYASAGNTLAFLRPGPGNLNMVKKGVREKQKTPMTVTAILLLALLILWVFYMITPLKAEEQRLAQIDTLIASKKEEVRKVEALKKNLDDLKAEISLIEHFKEGKPMTLNILKELTTILPASTWLTRVRITDTGVDIEGYASSATEILSKLEASKLLKKVEFASPTFRDARMNSDRFIIKMELEGVTPPVEEGQKNGKK